MEQSIIKNTFLKHFNPAQFVDMENRTVTLDDGSTAHTCTAAMGYSMWAGPMDGPTGQMPQVKKPYIPQF